jgi:hypothetical protein
VLERSIPRMRELDDVFLGRIMTRYSTLDAIETEVLRADVVIGAVLTAGAAAPKLVRREHLSKMRPGSVNSKSSVHDRIPLPSASSSCDPYIGALSSTPPVWLSSWLPVTRESLGGSPVTYFPIGALRSILPSAARPHSADAVNILVVEPRRNSISGRTASPVSMFAIPTAVE